MTRLSTTNSERPRVLIVGAGPTGLMLACQLARFGIPFRIVEKNAGPTTQSRALVIQARSLEIFEQMGIAERAVAQGRVFQTLNYVVNGKLAQRIPLGNFGSGLTRFPFLLMLEQSKTEPLLADVLARHGQDVEWRTELASLRQTAHGVSAVLRRGQQEEHIEVDWLVGTDGARSPVRSMLGIPFGGETYKESLFVLDCKIDWSFRDDEAAIALAERGFGLFFPMTDGRCRVSGIVSDAYADRETISFDEVNRDFARALNMDLTLSDPQWISLYHAHHRYVTHFRQGRCFLAGDAAHVHSPVGAQGMNTGLQDAYNLSWKLALVIDGRAKDSLLDTYQAERLPLARRLVQTTDWLFGFTISPHPIVRWMRVHLMPRAVALLPKVKPLLIEAFRLISQIGLHYRQSSLSAAAGSFPGRAPRPGDRLPFVTFREEGRWVSIQGRVSAPAFHLLLFTGDREGETLAALREAVTPYEGAIQSQTIRRTPETGALYRAFGIQRQGCYLVRPDMYIAFRSRGPDAAPLKNYLARAGLKA